jgi:phospholipid/cholesterol/gamma-HCH transport system substrate-binding protein
VAQRGGLLAGSKNLVLGITFMLILLLFAGLTYGIFAKKFTSYDKVELTSSRVGLQLPSRADVKIRGVQVGEVLRTSTDGDGAKIELGLYPSQIRTIPANVTARIIPKTLFGEKYVALQVPAQPREQPIRAGDTIRESHVAIEVEKVLNDIYPLLRTVQPAQLNFTLTAIANALEGRGEELGRTLVTTDDYLKRMNPKIPLLIDDLDKLATVSDTYAGVVPELADLLRNSVTTGGTFVEKEQKVKALFDDVAGLSDTSRDFLERNGQNIITLSEQGQAQLPLLAKYSYEYPCLATGLSRLIPRAADAFRNYTLHINLEVIPTQPRGYTAADQPRYDERGQHRVPLSVCNKAVNDGYGQDNLIPRSVIPPISDGVQHPIAKRAATGFDTTSGYAGTAGEQGVVDSLAAPVMGVPTDQVPDVTTLLFAPLARGTKASLR